eukprot:GHVP01026848.1.p1 GENE.GHVP01026848.1~~GHVP01026848.1.p1  ORF type:complete len:794 (+),score=142.23 GHVP01026848.1:206-2587(+)
MWEDEWKKILRQSTNIAKGLNKEKLVAKIDLKIALNECNLSSTFINLLETNYEEMTSWVKIAVQKHWMGKEICQNIIIKEEKEESSVTKDINYNDIQVYFQNFPNISQIEDLKSDSVGKFVRLLGSAVRVSPIRPLAVSIDFTCVKCGTLSRMPLENGIFQTPSECIIKNCRSRIFAPLRKNAETIDWQKVRLQQVRDEQVLDLETLGDDSRAAQQRIIDCELVGPVVGSCVPGDYVDITGIVKTAFANQQVGGSLDSKTLFTLYIDVFQIEQQKIGNLNQKQNTSEVNSFFRLFSEYSSQNPETRFNSKGLENSCDDDEVIFIQNPTYRVLQSFNQKDLATVTNIRTRHEDLFALLTASFCPEVFGHHQLKACLLLSLLGGVPVLENDNITTRRRGDIHVLIVGDAGLGKSKLIRYVATLSERGVFVCGNSSSSSGFTASVVKEAGTGDFTLEAGALVLADQGVCCIDEFDKMSAGEQQTFLEAMEQQTVSIAKAAIVCTLFARTSVVAAANPKEGAFRENKSLAENFHLPLPLLSRFDVVFILKDQKSGKADRELTRHILQVVLLVLILLNLMHSMSRRSSAKQERITTTSQLTENCTMEMRCQEIEESRSGILLTKNELQTYLRYSKHSYSPIICEEAARELKQFYLELRTRKKDNSIRPTARYLESLIRISQARAKLEGATEVTIRHVRDVLNICSSTAMCVEENTIPKTATGRPTKGKGLAAMLTPFRQMLINHRRKTNNNILTSSVCLDIAAQIADSVGSSLDPELLVSAANEAGYILKVPTGYSIA